MEYEIKIKDNSVCKFFEKHTDLIELFLSKIKGKTKFAKLKKTNLLKMRLKSKYRILFLVKELVVYVFFAENRDNIYNNKFEKEYKINNYEWSDLKIL